MARLTILNYSEYNALYKIPEFTFEERLEAFALDSKDKEIIDGFDEIALKINYVLQLGYFKVVQYFFNFTFQQVREDVWYIINTHFQNAKFSKKNLSSYQHYRVQECIRKKYSVSKSSTNYLNRLKSTIEFICKNDTTSKFLFESILCFAQQNNVIRPPYSTCQEMISTVLKNERRRLSSIIGSRLDIKFRKQIDNLLEKESSLYSLTMLKKDPKDFSTSEIKKEVNKHSILLDLYLQAQNIIPQLGISDNNIKFYSDLIEYYTIAKLKRNSQKNLIRLYLLCFIFNRFKQINENLIQSYVYRVSKYNTDSDEYQQQQIYEEKFSIDDNKEKAGRILNLYMDDKIPDEMLRVRAFEIIQKSKFKNFVRKVVKPVFDKNKYIWRYHQDNARTFKLNLRPIFNVVDFSCKNPELEKAVTFLKKVFSSGKDTGNLNYKELPIDFFPKSLRRYYFEKRLVDNKYKRCFVWNRYEFSIFLKLKEALEAGDVFIKDSITYKSLEDELISKDIWSKDKNKLLKKLDNKLLLRGSDEIISNLKNELNEAYKTVNKNILEGENKHIKITGKSNKKGKLSWKLPYKKEDDGVNNPFYENIPIRNISDILHCMSEKVDYIKYFSHLLPRYCKTELNKDALFAALTANATGLGINQMSNICDVKLSELETIESSFLSLENLKKANVQLTNSLSHLPIFKYYTLSDYGIHASIDGQKFETKVHTILARYSYKYFGFNKGVVAMTLLANNALINTKIIGANEYEGHYLFDMVYNNSTDVEINAVSGDMHSINKINFALLHLFGYRFMPRFTNLTKKTAKYLVAFKSYDSGSKDIIKPAGIVNDTLIRDEWDNILRILVSLALKKTNQATIIRKLTSFDRSNSTHKALIELDKIIMSLYMLNYIDDDKTRKNVQRVLNRGESYHQLKSAIVKTGSGKIAGKTPLQLNISNEATAFIASVIIYYNASILTQLLEGYKSKKDNKNIKLIMRLSPVAWQHINLLGYYEFCRNGQPVDIEAITQLLMNNYKINFALQTFEQ